MNFLAAIGLASAPDGRILAVASDTGGIVMTADLDYPRLLAMQQAGGPGVILFRGGSYSDEQMLALLDRVLAQTDTRQIEQSITVVAQTQIRRHRLPIVK